MLTERKIIKLMSELRQDNYEQILSTLIDILLHEEHEWLVIDAAEALGMIGDKRAIPPLLHALKSEERLKKWRAEWDKLPALKDRDKEAWSQKVFFLAETLAVEVSDIRSTAATSLGKLRAEQAIPELAEALNDSDGHVRDAAGKSLREIGTPQALAALDR